MKTALPHKALCSILLVVMGGFVSSASFAQICTREYAPLCGHVAGEPAPRTFPNRCMLDAASARFVSEGECSAMTTPQPMPRPGSDVDVHGCKGSAGYQWSEELNQCVRPWMSSAITLEVAAKRRLCTGVVEMQCLMVREWVGKREPGQAAPKWEPLFGDITGFQHTPGKRLTLRVRKDKIENPPADAPSTTYTLLKVLR